MGVDPSHGNCSIQLRIKIRESLGNFETIQANALLLFAQICIRKGTCPQTFRGDEDAQASPFVYIFCIFQN